MKSKGMDYSKTGAHCLPKGPPGPTAAHGLSKKVSDKKVVGHSPMKKKAVFRTGKSG